MRYSDFFRGEKIEKVALKGLDHVISISIIESRIHFRVFSIDYRKSGTKIPLTELAEIGPHFDLTLRRHSLPSEDMWKTACRKPKMYCSFSYVTAILLIICCMCAETVLAR